MPRSDFYSDTDPKALEVFLQLQREMSPADKVAMVFRLTTMAMQLAEDDVRRCFPLASEREIFLRAAARRLDRETMLRVYGWYPEGLPG
jgi:hypothetical protein